MPALDKNHQPPSIRQLSAPALKSMIDNGVQFELVDVRTEDERAIARIEGSSLLDQACHDRLLSLDRNTAIVFQCHHGVRSQSAASISCVRGSGIFATCRAESRHGLDSWMTRTPLLRSPVIEIALTLAR